MELKTLIKTQISQLKNKADKDNAIFTRLIKMNILKGKILIYKSLPYEVDTQALTEYYIDMAQVYIPRVNGDDLELVKVDKNTEYLQGEWGIVEPNGEPCNEDMDICVTPLVAFDKKLNRKGKGKGYYDRFFANNSCLKIGLAYDLQEREFCVNEWDVPLDIVITETRIIYRNNSEKNK